MTAEAGPWCGSADWATALSVANMRAWEHGYRYVVRRSHARPMWLVMRKMPIERVPFRPRVR